MLTKNYQFQGGFVKIGTSFCLQLQLPSELSAKHLKLLLSDPKLRESDGQLNLFKHLLE